MHLVLLCEPSAYDNESHARDLNSVLVDNYKLKHTKVIHDVDNIC